MKEEDFQINLKILNYNLRKISLISKLIISFVVVLMLFRTILYELEILRLEEQSTFSYVHYMILIVLNLFVIYLVEFKKIDVTQANAKRVDFLISSYATIFISIGAILSLIDQIKYHSLMPYPLILLITCSFLVLRVKQILVPLAVSSCILAFGLVHQNASTILLKQQFVYVFSLMPIAYFVSQSVFSSFNRSITIKMKLLKEAEITKALTKQLQEANEKLEHQASIDPLTNLSNRRGFNQYVKDLEMKEKPYQLTAVMIDVDCFKLFNDTYGHKEGDRVLNRIGQLLSKIANDYSCFVARWGGEEFAMLLVDQSYETAEKLCDQIVDEVKKLEIEHKTSCIDRFVTVSIGACSELIINPRQISTCINEADKALYFVKESGRNDYLHFKVAT